MSCDTMGPKGRAWIIGGGEWFYDPAWREPVLLALGAMPPVLVLPAMWLDETDGWWRSERAFGWALAELFQRRHGWLDLIAMIRHLAEAAAVLAAVVVQYNLLC
jgi:hypothetical protein